VTSGVQNLNMGRKRIIGYWLSVLLTLFVISLLGFFCAHMFITDPETNLKLAQICDRFGLDGMAVRYYGRCIDSMPSHNECRCGRGYRLLMLGHLEGAREDLIVAVNTHVCPGAWMSLARVYHRLGRIEDAKSAYRRVVDLEGLSVAYQRLFEVFVLENPSDHASVFFLWKELFPESPPVNEMINDYINHRFLRRLLKRILNHAR